MDVALREGVREADGVLVRLGVTVGLREAEVLVEEGEIVPLREHVGENVPLRVRVGEVVPLRVSGGDGVPLRVSGGEGVPLGVAVGVPDALGVAVGVPDALAFSKPTRRSTPHTAGCARRAV